jgi:hypothetical protein
MSGSASPAAVHGHTSAASTQTISESQSRRLNRICPIKALILTRVGPKKMRTSREHPLPARSPIATNLCAGAAILAVDFHRVRRFARCPVHGQGLTAMQAHAEAVDLLRVVQ